MSEPLTITLSPDLSEKVRAQAASHGYANEAEFVEDRMSESIYGINDESWGPSDEWIIKHALPALDELEANPASGLSHDDLLAQLATERAQLAEKAS